ncbi:uncharacterized protein BDV14DRAFT_198196 [Aspergillus stella-maris]|uniref:uncharacterized protein n=1 Tax=Aspergillus stella-maris TaxID=1810926 RepID=UPI003CCD1688
MAVPAEMTIATLSGQFVPNKALSDDADSSLALQGVPWLLRKGISLASPKFVLSQATEDGTAVVSITVSGVGSGVTEKRVLNWEPVEGKNPLFGKTESEFEPYLMLLWDSSPISSARSRLYTSPLQRSESHSEEDIKFLNAETFKNGAPSSWAEDTESQHLHCIITNSEAGWTMEQVWGFEELDGKKYHTRRSIVKKGEAVERGKLVYNYSS